ncbi:5'-nucleotidase [Maridesulfovibrio ferrireducens]|uniref:5'-nucleotidase n=1 Tax=Maridesulfovibrio ferrireducens TaxID=246191 RepID=A0A1G9HRF5_9BACT|nr:bifunctional UDP-sugar hydrolase/5'-nucleotidase [Maridesulfovibrio ferrireducens]SDL15520.1 5'-nucleotidase [Maridesulfovibrio ferrireducens]
MRPLMTLISLITFILLSTPCLASRWNLVLLTTSGLNGQLIPASEKEELNNGNMLRTFGGFARIQTVFESYREKFPGETITIATGDDLLGESIQEDQGKIVFGAMNLMGFDVSTLGNHEFDRGSNFLAKCLTNKKFPTVVSNLEINPSNRLLKHVKPYTVIERNLVRVGFMGLILPNLKMISNPGTATAVKSNLIEIARSTALKLKKEEQANIIVLLSHLSIEDQKTILEAVPEIDIICGGQSHKDILPGQELIARDAPTPGIMVQCGARGRFVGVLKLQIEDGYINKHDWTIIPVTASISPNKKTFDFIQANINGLQSPTVLATSTQPLNTEVKVIRIQDVPVGKLVSSILQDKFKTDVAFQNSGGIRGDKIIPAGPIKANDVDTMFPFGNTVTIIKVTGETLKQVLERSVHKLPESSGGYLQTSGVKYTLDLKGTPQEITVTEQGKPIGIRTKGSRISNIKITDKSGKYIPVEKDKMYSVATNSFLARGGDGYIMLKNSKDKVETFIKISKVIKSGLTIMKKIPVNNEITTLNLDRKPFFPTLKTAK